MAESFELQEISNTVEALFCAFDLEADEFNDTTAAKLLEMAFDKYHFNTLHT